MEPDVKYEIKRLTALGKNTVGFESFLKMTNGAKSVVEEKNHKPK